MNYYIITKSPLFHARTAKKHLVWLYYTKTWNRAEWTGQDQYTNLQNGPSNTHTQSHCCNYIDHNSTSSSSVFLDCIYIIYTRCFTLSLERVTALSLNRSDENSWSSSKLLMATEFNEYHSYQTNAIQMNFWKYGKFWTTWYTYYIYVELIVK